MADFNAIAQAIATRFSSTNVTAPSGETNVRVSTSALPSQVIATPTVLVFPPETVPLRSGMGLRHGRVTFPVRFYIARIQSNDRNSTLLLKWLGSLYAQLDGQAHLGLASYVADTQMDDMRVGRLTYGGEDYEGIEIEVAVVLAEASTSTA